MDTVIYVVQQGDTLFDIAKKYNTTANMIARYNGIIDTDFLEVDRVLRIPVSTIPNINTNREYTVQNGDTLTKIAEKYGTTVDALVRLNGITNPNKIEVGQVIKIPFSASPKPKPMPIPGINDNDNKIKYIVESGDTLWKIAGRYGVTVVDLINLNRLTQPDLIYPGQVIIIPE